MATRAAKTAASSIARFSIKGNKKSGVDVATLITVERHGFAVSKRRWLSSSVSLDYPPSLEAARKLKKNSLNDRLSSVIDAVNDRKLPPELRGQRNNVRSETDIINVVEQRIWQSMEEGHFENLPGKGKPLDLKTNPHADPADDTLYRILSKNGCAPEWVELNKQIRIDASEWRSSLRKAWNYKINGNNAKWIECSVALKAQMTGINNKVFRYNLVAPFGRQMLGITWEKELNGLLES